MGEMGRLGGKMKYLCALERYECSTRARHRQRSQRARRVARVAAAAA